MSKLTEMIEALCPDGVDYVKLGEVCEIIRGTRVTKKDLITDGKYPVVSGGVGFMGYLNDYNREAETITIAQYGTAGYVNWQEQQFWANDICFCVNPNKKVIKKYLYYFLTCKQNYLYSISNRDAIPYSIDREKILNISFPLPPLPIQQEIVRILDTFTQLQTELQTELQLRRKQYNYYREHLLTFPQDVERKKLGEIGTFTRGNGLQKKDFTETGFPCIHYGQIYTYYGNSTDKTKSFVSFEAAKKFKKAKKGDLIIATTSENIEDVCKTLVWLGENEVCVSGETYIFAHNQEPRYVAYCLQTHRFFDFKQRNYTGTKVIRLHKDKLEQFEIPLPPLSKQREIASILDKFSALTTSLTEGIPAEIELRRKQYNYYRELLLTFKHKAL